MLWSRTIVTCLDHLIWQTFVFFFFFFFFFFLMKLAKNIRVLNIIILTSKVQLRVDPYLRYGSTRKIRVDPYFTGRPVNASRPVKYGSTRKYTGRPAKIRVDPYYTGRPVYLRVDPQKYGSTRIWNTGRPVNLRVDPYFYGSTRISKIRVDPYRCFWPSWYTI